MTFAKEKLRHVKDAHDVLTEQLDALKIKHSKAAQDYTHISQHRERQIKASGARWALANLLHFPQVLNVYRA